MQTQLNSKLKPVVDVYEAQVQPRVRKLTSNPKFVKVKLFAQKHLATFARVLICWYFINLSVTNFNYWYKYNVPGVPWTAFPMFPCALFVLFNFKTHIFGSILVLLAAKDAGHITYNQLYIWLVYKHDLYINELMVKKLSMTGAMVMILVNDPFFKTAIDRTSKALSGLVLKDEPKYAISKKLSVILLIVRILISSLFIFVGYGEIKRQIQWSSGVVHHGHRHSRPKGDGHDQMWPKLAEFALSLPFIVGFKTKAVSFALATCLVLEALIYWNFWATLLGIGYSIHARDHFSVNIGVAGGLLLLQSFGGGKYSVDELLKKND